ncbi:hypothetical protein GCM10027075_19560 [Streptomyces heilongjiangensis]
MPQGVPCRTASVGSTKKNRTITVRDEFRAGSVVRSCPRRHVVPPGAVAGEIDGLSGTTVRNEAHP